MSNLEAFFGFRTFGEQALIDMLQAAYQFALGIKQNKPPYWLVLLGKSGNGKTHLARRINRWFQRCGKFYEKPGPAGLASCVRTGGFTDWREFVATVREGDYGAVSDLCSDWFAVLDDIGTEYDPKGHIASVADRVINARLGKWTVITCNLLLDQIAVKMDARIASRMLRDGGKVIQIRCPDFNLRKG